MLLSKDRRCYSNLTAAYVKSSLPWTTLYSKRGELYNGLDSWQVLLFELSTFLRYCWHLISTLSWKRFTVFAPHRVLFIHLLLLSLTSVISLLNRINRMTLDPIVLGRRLIIEHIACDLVFYASKHSRKTGTRWLLVDEPRRFSH